MVMKKVLKIVNAVPSTLLFWGAEDGENIIICITGNPGLVDFYIEFGEELYRLSSIPICIIGQAGHEAIADSTSNTLENQPHLYNLEGQIEHKFDLISTYIDKKSKLHLIGHSIGAWQVIELIDKYPMLIERIASVNLLFPTIQHMAKSPNGKILNNFTRKIHFIILMLLNILNLVPKFITNILINVYLLWNSLPSHYLERINKVINPKVMEKVLFLAFDEMDTVKGLNRNAIEKIKKITNVIYTKTDKWVPPELMNDLKIYEPNICLQEVRVDHAFVLKSSKFIAEKVASFIKGRQNV